MKKILLLVCLSFMLVLGGCEFQTPDNYLRIHIRANSNSAVDQSIKYEVKNLCVEYLTEYVPNCKSKDDVVSLLNNKKRELKNIIDEFLVEKGFNYSCNININNEFFPSRTYDDLTLEANYYDALIINLGSGTGNNWWCVVYPPLCFNGGSNVVYKSKIKEIINKIWG